MINTMMAGTLGQGDVGKSPILNSSSESTWRPSGSQDQAFESLVPIPISRCMSRLLRTVTNVSTLLRTGTCMSRLLRTSRVSIATESHVSINPRMHIFLCLDFNRIALQEVSLNPVGDVQRVALKNWLYQMTRG